MIEFIKICAAVGIFTLYALVTGVPGAIAYHFLKHTTIDKPADLSAAAKSVLVSYGIGFMIFVGAAVHFVLMRG